MSNVNHPKHYNHGSIEVAVAMDILNGAGQWLGHALKYACRAPHKGKFVEDIEKAIWCADRVMKHPDVGWSEEVSAAQREVILDALVSGVSNVNSEQRTVVVELIDALVHYNPLDDFRISALVHSIADARAFIARSVSTEVDMTKAQLATLGNVPGKPKLDMKSLKNQVKDFQWMIGRPSPAAPVVHCDVVLRHRLRLITEEYFEVLEASFAGNAEWVRELKGRTMMNLDEVSFVSPDLPEIVDGLADLDFVVEGTRQELGVDGEPIAFEVYKANMAKQSGPVDEKGKKRKPEGWQPPDVAGELRKQGWRG